MIHCCRLPRFGPVLVLLTVCLLLPACAVNKKINKANFDKIKPGMTLAEVEAILGPGEKESTGDGSNVAGQFGVGVGDLGSVSGGSRSSGSTYNWESGGKSIKVYFSADGKVTRPESKGL